MQMVNVRQRKVLNLFSSKIRHLFSALLILLTASSHAAGQSTLTFDDIGNGTFVHHGVHEDISEGYHGDICNISFIIGKNGIAVIDTGGSLKVGQQLLAAIRQQSSLPILYVINTHVHPDHIFGNAAFLPEHATFVGHAKLAEAMERRRDAYTRLNNTLLENDATGSDIVKPTIAVANTMTLDLGDRMLTLTAYPTSHTNTDLTVQDSTSGALWTGDLLFVERTPSIDGDIKGWLSSIERLKSHATQQTIPGHGPVLKDASAALKAEQRYLNTLLTDVRADIKKGIVMEKAMDTAAQSEKDQWQLFEVVNRRNVNRIYPELEWE